VGHGRPNVYQRIEIAQATRKNEKIVEITKVIRSLLPDIHARSVRPMIAAVMLIKNTMVLVSMPMINGKKDAASNKP
jgi:hypothetical protein